MKWEPIAMMLLVVVLGSWLVTGPGRHRGLPPAREGAETHPVRIGPTRGEVELLRVEPDEPDTYSWRLLYRGGEAVGPLTNEEFGDLMGETPRDEIIRTGSNAVFRIFNITSWSSLLWIVIGLGGQGAFFGRMAIQWIASEREKRSVVPPLFWWLSLVGGAALFTYFVWRQDFVGVLGQSTGVVIYARNIRLLHNQKKRELRAAEQAMRVAGKADTADTPHIQERGEST